MQPGIYQGLLLRDTLLRKDELFGLLFPLMYGLFVPGGATNFLRRRPEPG